MLVISTLAILFVAAAYHMWRHSGEQPELRGSHGEILRLGVQIICGDCCGDSDRPVKTYLDQFGRCGQCGGRSYVLASAYARHGIMGLPSERDGTTTNARRQSFGSQVSLHAVRVHKIGA